MELCMKLKGDKQLFLYLKFRDILKENTDILVNETISDVKLNRVKIKEGEVIMKDLYDEKIKRNLKRPLKEGQIALTSKGNFPNKNLIYILHLPPVIYKEKNGSKNILKSNILRCLMICEKEKLKKITFPAMSTGIYGFSNDDCADCFMEAIIEFYKNYEVNYVNKISINLNDYQIYEDFEKNFLKKKQDIISLKYDDFLNRNIIREDTNISNFVKFRDIQRKYRMCMWLSLLIFIAIAFHLSTFMYELCKVKFDKKTVKNQEYSTRYIRYLEKVKELKVKADRNKNHRTIKDSEIIIYK